MPAWYCQCTAEQASNLPAATPPDATQTPLTNKVAHGCSECGPRVDADFARQLELALTSARADVMELVKELDAYLQEPSTDGRIVRQAMRSKLRELVERHAPPRARDES